MQPAELIQELNSSLEFFERSSRCLTEDDSNFRPVEGMFTAAQQTAHVAQTIDWFLEAASRPEGFDMNFEKHFTSLMGVTSMTEARGWVRRSFDAALAFLASKSESDLEAKLPEGPIMGGEPIWHVFPAMVEHTAHHRGALSVYSRVTGKVPAMPYGEM